MNDAILKSFIGTKRHINEHVNYPTKPGVYAFFLSENANLFEFGKGNQLVYIGIAKESLHDRDLSKHFKTGKSGSSTLRRSIGAILKSYLKLIAIPRGSENDKKRFENYKFDKEQILTDWMIENVEIGYWIPDKTLLYSELREIEKQLTIAFKPTLDLDIRTRRFNPLASKLKMLRNVCKKEACRTTLAGSEEH